jgi:hypothetical protein
MSLRALTCPRCGAPLPKRAHHVVVPCTFCGASVVADGEVVHAAAFRRAHAALARPDEAGPRVEVAGFPYRLLGRVAVGESSDVFLAERAHPITERVLLKILRADADADLMEREWEVLTRLLQIPDLGPETARRLPALVGRGVVAGTDRRALVMLAPSGFVDTFADVRRAFPGGVDGRHAVWMWRRVLEVLTGVHQAGVVHGAVLPQHLVVHARDHGVMLVGWSCGVATSSGAPPRVVSTVARECYPAELLAGGGPTRETDVIMSARCVALLLGGTAERVPPAVPAPLKALVERVAAGETGGGAWRLRQQLGAAAQEAYGPPQYHPFPMPGWQIAGA